jgi:diacylglycerol kinase (ATP)
LTRKAAADGATLVVAVGGDGTVNEAVNGLLELEPLRRPELAVVPRGTGDDFARTFRIPKALDRALRIAAAGPARVVDVGVARYTHRDGSPGERYFANFAGAGISGAIAIRGAATSRRLGARAAYFWATVAVFARWQSVEMTVVAAAEERRGSMYEVFVANGAYTAGGMRVAPDAVPDDGLLEVVLIGDFTKPEFLTTFPKIYRGTHVAHQKIEVLRAGSVTVEAATPLPVVLDGEQPGTTPAAFEVVPKALRLRVPA